MNVFPSGLGVGVPSQTHPDPYPALDRLNPAWWYDWGRRSTGNGWPTSKKWEPLYVPQMWRTAEPYRTSPFSDDRAWLFFNEPNQRGQGVIEPISAAREAWQLWNYGAKRMIVGNCIIDREVPYDDRLGWYSGYLRNGGPVPEAWGIHLYGWGNGDPMTLAGVKAKVRRFEKWMKAHDVVRPIIVSEVSAQRAPVADQIAVLLAVKKLLRSGDIMAAAWFSVSYHTWGDDLLRDGKLTELGQAFVA